MGRRSLINKKWIVSLLPSRCDVQNRCFACCLLGVKAVVQHKTVGPNGSRYADNHQCAHTHSLSAAPGLSIFASRKTQTQKEAGGWCGGRGHHFIKLKRVTALPKTRHKQFKLSKQTRVIGPRLPHCRRRRYELTPKYLHPIFSGARWVDGYGFAGAG